MSSQAALDESNVEFWEELCGTPFARRVGIEDASPESLDRFDRAYLDMYPYLERRYLPRALAGARVLEIGLGFGTVGTQLIRRGADYRGVDIAHGPVEMMRHRLRIAGRNAEHAAVASALELPFPDSSFDRVVSIGCLHHTGNLVRAVQEVRRVLRPGGESLVMLYNRNSLRQLGLRVRYGVSREALRAAYDQDSEGEAAPVTEFVSRAEVRRLFRAFSAVRVASENFDLEVSLLRGRIRLPRRLFLGNLARVAGLDLYIRAVR
jgi:SAM-dependent methyltransferase